MKIGAREAAGFCARPPAGLIGALIHGEDAGAVAALRDALLAAALGADAAAEMRLDRVPAQTLRGDAAALDAALRAKGFFPGPRAALALDATDALARPILAALDGAAEPASLLVVTAGPLPAKSLLRRAFEAHARAAAVAADAGPPDRATIVAALERAGARAVSPEAAAALEALGRAMDAGSFARLIETTALHHGATSAPLAEESVAACAPPDPGAEAEAALSAALEGRPEALRPLLARLAARGGDGTAMAIAALRRLRLLHRLAVEAGNGDWEQAAAQMRPPLYGARRDEAIRQARRWGPAALEEAIGQMLEADAMGRGGSAAPPGAVVERALMRLALRPGR